MSDLRQTLRTQRQQLSPPTQQSAAQHITQQLQTLPQWRDAQHVGVYLPIRNEVDTQLIIDALSIAGKSVYLPVCSAAGLVFTQYTANTTLNVGHFQLREPEITTIIAAADLDWVLLPLLAFDQHGTRMGWGHGYYDRTFAFLLNTPRPTKPHLTGLAYAFQYQPALPRQAWDVPLNDIITEEKIWRIGY